jgi:hypothetical protein
MIAAPGLAMSLLPVFQWLQGTPVGQAIRNSATLIALVEIIHLVGMTLLIGAILMVDLSLLGLGIGGQPVSRIARELNNWIIAGLALMLVSGPLILSSEALRCFKAPMFWVKMALLAAALAFHFTLHRQVTLAEPPAARRLAGRIAAISLALWIGVALAAKGIALSEP